MKPFQNYPTAPQEQTEQVVLLQRVRARLPELFKALAAVPNGGTRQVREAAALVRAGVKRGYPDLLVDLPRGPYHGCRIEMKRQNASPSKMTDDQRAWGKRLEARGYLWAVACGQDQAYDLLEAYWDLGDFNPEHPGLRRSQVLQEYQRRYHPTKPWLRRGSHQ